MSQSSGGDLVAALGILCLFAGIPLSCAIYKSSENYVVATCIAHDHSLEQCRVIMSNYDFAKVSTAGVQNKE